MHPARANLRYIGASDFSKAYDRMHGRLAGKALNRLGVPEALARTWEKAWTQQSRFFFSLENRYQNGTCVRSTASYRGAQRHRLG